MANGDSSPTPQQLQDLQMMLANPAAPNLMGVAGPSPQPNVPAQTQTPAQQPDINFGTPQAVQETQATGLSQPSALQQGQPQAQGPPKMGGAPLLARFMTQMFGGQQQRGYAPAPAGQPGRPLSRLDAFESFIGEFLDSFSQGLAASGRGPGANLRGLAAGIQAPYQRALQQYGVGQQAQMQQAQIGEAQARQQLLGAQTGLAEAQTRAYSNMVMTPLGPLPLAYASRLFPELVRSQTQQTIAGEQIASREKVAGEQIASREKVAGQSLAERMAEFRTTDDYRKWKENFDNQTKLQIAQMNMGKAPAQIMQTAVFAKGGLDRMADAEAAMQQLEQSGVMGTVGKNKLEDWVFGTGAVDPRLDSATRNSIGRLRAALGYTSSATMRAHTGRTSQEIYRDFKNRLGAGQDWSALRGAMDETRSLLTDYALAASNQNIMAIRQGQGLAQGGGAPAPTPAPAAGGGAPTQFSPNNPFAPKQKKPKTQ